MKEIELALKAGERMFMNCEKRMAIVEAINRRPVKDNLPNQKFKRGQRVKISDEMPPGLKHFSKGLEAIVEYTYAQKFWGNDVDSYCLIILESGTPINSIAWYSENQLTPVDEDCNAGMAIIKDYKLNLHE